MEALYTAISGSSIRSGGFRILIYECTRELYKEDHTRAVATRLRYCPMPYSSPTYFQYLGGFDIGFDMCQSPSIHPSEIFPGEPVLRIDMFAGHVFSLVIIAAVLLA